MRIGILALQGNYIQHARLLESLSYSELSTVLIRRKVDLSHLDAIILPGGESTTMLKLLMVQDMYQELLNVLRSGIPVLATCAGVIFLSKRVFIGEESSKEYFSAMNIVDVDVRKNAYGRQIHSFVAEVDFHPHSGSNPYHVSLQGMFIRAPKIIRIGEGVEILAYYEEDPVIIQKKNILMSTFHPEALMRDELHHYFLQNIVMKHGIDE